jgi:hypothetical protein
LLAHQCPLSPAVIADAATTNNSKVPGRSFPSATAAAVPPPRKLLRLCHSPFEIAVINAVAATADSNPL